MSIEIYTSFIYGARLELKSIPVAPLIRYDQMTGKKKSIAQYQYQWMFSGTDILMPDDERKNFFGGCDDTAMFGVLIADIDPDKDNGIFVLATTTGGLIGDTHFLYRETYNDLIDEYLNKDDAVLIKAMSNFTIFAFYN